MDSEKYSRSVKLLCSTCGGGDFEYDDEQSDSPMRCTSCDRIFTRAELVRENGAIIDENVDEVKAEVVADARKQLNDTLRKAFAGSKRIKFR